MTTNTVFQIGYTEEVSCYFCRQEQLAPPQYKRGEAFLATAMHSPCDGNSNYICKAHLDGDAVIKEPAVQYGDRLEMANAMKALVKNGMSEVDAKARVSHAYEALKKTGRVINVDDFIKERLITE